MVLNKVFSIGVLFLAALAGAQNVSAYTVPDGLGGGTTGVPEAGYPNFNNGGDFRLTKRPNGVFQLTGYLNSRSPFTFNTGPDQSWTVERGTFSFLANFAYKGHSDLEFNPKGSVVGYSGKISGYDGPGETSYRGRDVRSNKITLFKAPLVDFGFDSSPLALGFETDAEDATGWAAQFMSSNESVWITGSGLWQRMLDNIALNSHRRSWSIDLKGLQVVTTVPLPAAVWLFGSALAGLAGAGWRKRPAAVFG